MPRTLIYVVTLLVVGGIYFLLVHFGFDLAALDSGATAISPPAGFALATVVLAGYRVVPAFVAAACVAAFIADPGRPEAIHAVALAADNACGALAGGALINWWAGGRAAFAAPTGVARFVLIAVVAAMVGAGVGSIVTLALGPEVDLGGLLHIGQLDRERLFALWLPWWLGDLAALLMITPAIVLWATDRPRSFDPLPFLESAAIFAATAASAAVAFSPLMEPPSAAPLALLVVLPMTWAALRRGPRDTATATVIALAFAGWGTLFGGGPFVRSADAAALVLILLLAIATPSLVLAADAAQRRRAERSLGAARGELGRAREQFAQAQKMEAVGQLTGGVAHDFNNLLTVIVGNLTMAQRHLESLTEAPAERLRRVINNALRGAERATTITKQLLAFSRKEAIEPKRLDINALVHGMSDFLRRTLGETITLEIVAAADVWPAEADPVQLEAAILNLAVNARDAMAAGGKLTIATRNVDLDETHRRQDADLAAGRYVAIEINDTGAGMSKDVLDRVFEPFFTTKKAGQGTGLGLSQVYGFVKQAKGHVQIDSEPAKGTAVTIYLPALAGTVQTEPVAERASAFAAAAPTILLVEDDHDVRAHVVEILRELNYRVLEAHDAESALAMLDRNDVRVDLLLADLILPGMNGGQLAETVKARQPEVRVVLMTGYARDAVAEPWPAGIEMLQKPLTPDAIAHTIRAVLE